MDNRSRASAIDEISGVVTLGRDDAGEILTLQRAAYVTEVAAHNDFTLSPSAQTLAALKEELTDPTAQSHAAS